MRRSRVVTVFLIVIAAVSPAVYGQSAPKPSPYTGVSQPPSDATITVDEATAPVAAAVGKPAVPLAIAAPAEASVPAPAVSASLPVVPAAAVPSGASPRCNPDDRMIGDPLPCEAGLVERSKPVSSTDPDAGIVTVVPSRPGELPEGTVIRMAMNEELRSGVSQPGSDFSGRVAADVLFSGRVVIPQGAEVLGKVMRVTDGHRMGAPATIRLRPDVIILPDGSRYVMRAQVIDSGSKARVDSEGALKAASRLKTNVIKEGAGIGAGAVAGALIGGPPGALVGSLIGAGVMTTNILVQHPGSVRVPKDSTLTLSLTQPMAITPVTVTN